MVGVTGTKGKSTVVYMAAKIFEAAGQPVAAIGSLGMKIKDKEWPNTIKMTMPGRFTLQKFLRQAVNAGCQYVFMEVTSEGIKQMRHIGINFDTAVFTNLHPEHIESHGSFERYAAAKQVLFKKTKNIHILNTEDPHCNLFGNFPAKQKIRYGLQVGDVTQLELGLKLKLEGEFNIYNALAALSITKAYGLNLAKAKAVLESITTIPGRMEIVQGQPFKVVVDYAHTPDSLEAVYKTLKPQLPAQLVCVLGACGGGRDTWKRPEFGRIADTYCDQIILTNEDPYDEDPQKIIHEVRSGIQDENKITEIIDRKEAITYAIRRARPGDTVIITGKGSETSIALAGGKKLPWSDKEVTKQVLAIK